MESVAIRSKEEIVRKEKRKVIVLVSKGNIPKDYPKDKLIEYLTLKFEKSKEIDRKRLEDLEEELRKWPRNPNNDPIYFAIINLSEELRYALGFTIEFAFENYCSPSLQEVLYDLISKGYSSIIIVPLDFLGGLEEDTLKDIERMKNENSVEILIAWPYKVGLQADFIATHILSFIRKNF